MSDLRFLGGLGVVFTAIHVLALIADSYVTTTIVSVLVPFTGNYRVTELAWGIVAMYLLVAVEVTSLLRGRLGKRLWRGIHYLSFPLFLASTVHLLIGTDRATMPERIRMPVAVAVVCVATLIRIIQADSRRADEGEPVFAGSSSHSSSRRHEDHVVRVRTILSAPVSPAREKTS